MHAIQAHDDGNIHQQAIQPRLVAEPQRRFARQAGLVTEWADLWADRRTYASTAMSVLMSMFLCASLLLTGCAKRTTAFQITDYRSDGSVDYYQETFDEAFFDVDGSGNLDVVFRRSQPATPERDIDLTQIIRLRTFWRPIPGRTAAETTQINGIVSYAIITGNIGTTFEGAGSIFFEIDEDSLTGSLDLAILEPTRHLKAGSRFFNKAELSGKFTARRSPRHVIRIVNDLNRQFGPTPRLIRDPS